MSDKKSSEKAAPAAEEAPAKSGGLLRTIVIVFLLIGIAGVGFVMGGRGGAAPAAPAAADGAPAEAEKEAEKEKKGPIVEMEPINVNLAEGHYLRIAVALGLSPEVKLKEPEEFDKAAASDVVLGTFSGMAMADLTSTEGEGTRASPQGARAALRQRGRARVLHGVRHAVTRTATYSRTEH